MSETASECVKEQHSSLSYTDGEPLGPFLVVGTKQEIQSSIAE